ncbi:MAG: DUF1326 domain-containing protein [Bryobacteraceae bacterium]
MRLILGLAMCICASAGVRGTYVEARNADVYTGPCFANGEVGQLGNLAVFGWNISRGTWEGVDLSGLTVVGVLKARHALGDVYETSYPIHSVLIVDSQANPEQRLALQHFARRMGGDLFETVVRVDYQPIRFTLKDGNVHSRAASLVAGSQVEIRTRPLDEGDQICHNEEVWYPPLIKLEHAMPAATLVNRYLGEGLGTTWSSPEKRSAFVGTFAADGD